MWKNWLIQKRKRVLTAFEIGLPVFFAIVFFGVRQLVKVEHFDKPVEFNPLTIDSYSGNDQSLIYTPDTPIVKSIVSTTATNLGITSGKFIYLKSTFYLEKYEKNL